MKAKLIKTGLLRGNANHYLLNDGRNIMVSRANTADRGDETMIFPCDLDGEITSWGDLYQGFRESHEEALSNFGVTEIE